MTLTLHQSNKGLSAARNAGLEMVRGETIAFMDADDVYHPNFITNMIDAMYRQEADIIICKYSECDTCDKIIFDVNAESKPSINQGLHDKVSSLQFLVNGLINHNVWNKLYMSYLWEGIRFPEGHVYEDIDATFRILNRCDKVYVIDKTLYYHRWRKGSITATKSQINLSDWILAYSHFESFVESNYPNYFTLEQVKKCHSTRVNAQIRYYCSCPINRGDKLSTKSSIRNQILRDEKGVELKYCGNLTKMLFWMLCVCPNVLNFLFPPIDRFYHYLKYNSE